MRYEHFSITPETESDEVTESNAEKLLPIPSKCEEEIRLYDNSFPRPSEERNAKIADTIIESIPLLPIPVQDDTMADVNVNAPAGQAPTMEPPVPSDDKILPHIRWVPIGKSNCYLDVEKSQSNPIHKIAVDILKHTNFFRAFTASSTIPSIYIHQFWDTFRYDKSAGCYRALTTIINLCLTGKTSGFERPRAPVLQILWGVVTQAHIDYAERIWEEFTQSIHTFIEDKRNLAQRNHGKKKATLIVILSIRFTKLIIYHLQRKHKFHPRPDSPLYIPNEEPILGYLKFSAKGTKREVFAMPISSSLITADIQEASYYQEYLAKVAKYQMYLAGETGILKPVSSTQPEPTSAPAKPQGKKRKLTTKISYKPSQAIKSWHGFEPRVDDEEADVQRALEESMKSMYDVPRGPLLPVVIREPEFRKYQPLPESPADRYILQRHTSTPTGSFGHDESSSLYAKLGLTDSEEESKEDMPGANAGGQCEGQAAPDLGAQAEGQAGPDPSAQDEGQARSNPNEQPEGQARPDLSNTKTSQPMPSPMVHAGSDREHMDRDVANVSPPPPPEQIDEGSESPKVHQLLKATATKTTTTTTTTLLPPPYQQQQSTTEAMMMKRIGELEHIMANLIQENKRLEQRDLPEADMKEILHQRIWETDSYKSHEDNMQLYEALEKSMNRDHSEELAKDLAEARKKKKKSRESPKMPPGSPPHQPPPLLHQQDMAPDEQAQSSNDEDIGSAHIPKVNLRQDWWKPLEEERPATPEPAYVDDSILRHNVSKPLPLGGLPGQVTIQSNFIFNKDLEYLRYGSQGSGPALSISKMKAAYYLDIGLEQMVPDQIWIEEECKYDIAAIAVRTHMRILSVVRIKVFSMYGYDYMKKIFLCRTDLNKHVIAERDFKYLYPSDFEDMYLLNHLPPKDKKILTTAVNQWTRHLVIRQRGFEYKHDYTVIDSPRAVTFQNRYGVQMIMRFNEIHKFSDGTLQQIDEALDYRVKELRINKMNPGLNTRFWTRKDVDRSKEYMFAIQKQLKTRMIFRNLESFVGGRVRDGDYRLLKRTE
nr:histone deacetylase 14 [Tanacetum cinerariifolium]